MKIDVPGPSVKNLLPAAARLLSRTGIATIPFRLKGFGPRAISLSDLLSGQAREALPAPGQATIVVPVYNNFDDVVILLRSLQSTVGDLIKVILVNDCSSDQRILPLLTSASVHNPNWVVINNEQNLGFAGAVNRGIMAADGHVIVLNSDVEFPAGWVERLLAPIVLHPAEIGSVTPFSNHSSLTGFPKLGSEVPLSALGHLDSVDHAFRTLNPIYPDIPSGIGFCLAMNRKVIEEIGLLDTESYRQGYYEDTDWCQRLVAKGYRNVVCGNLFVHHKVGSKSFSIEARQALSKVNRTVFDARYPYYEFARQRFHNLDPLLEIRTLAQAMLWRRDAKTSHLIVGQACEASRAKDFAGHLRKSLLDKKAFVVELVLRDDKADVTFYFGENNLKIQQSYSRELWRLANHFTVDQLILNGVHGANQRHDNLAEIYELALLRPVTIYIHNLLGIQYLAFSTDERRRDWQKVLSRAKEINLFSQSSKDLLLRVYPDLKGRDIRIVDPEYTVGPTAEKTPQPGHKIQTGALARLLAALKGAYRKSWGDGGEDNLIPRKAFIHIGLVKTGTTSIQRQLARVRKKLPARGFYFPRTGVINKSTGHHCLAWHLADSPKQSEFCAGFSLHDFTQEIETAKAYNLLVSSEELSSLSFSYSKIRSLLRLFPQHEIYVVAYVREQAEFFNSFYLELLSDFDNPGRIDDFIEERLAEPRYDYSHWFAMWADLLGKNVIIRPYDKKALSGADVVKDFWDVVGLEGLVLPHSTRQENVSLNNLQTAVMMELIRRVVEHGGGQLPPPPKRRIFKKIANSIISLPELATGERFWGIGPDLLRKIRERYASSNQEFFRMYGMPGFVYQSVFTVPTANACAFTDLDPGVRRRVESMWTRATSSLLL